MTILKCVPSDIDNIMHLYDLATTFQHTKNLRNTWQGFDKDVVVKEIEAGSHWKIIENDKIACVFLTVFSDPIIWAEKNNDSAVYIHRIATNPDFRGKGYVNHIISFCKNELNEIHPIEYIRMDTHAGNPRLNAYYERCGFSILGEAYTEEVPELPAHYQNEAFTLFEIEI